MTIIDYHKSCLDCGRKACQKSESERYPDFCLTKNSSMEELADIKGMYTENRENLEIMKVTAKIQADTYGTLTRVEETVLFAKEMGYHRIGIATCTALMKESTTLKRILEKNGFEVFSACCKVGAVSKEDIGICPEHITQGPNICNPAMQAKFLNEAKVDFAIVMGLCVGHDTIFHKYIEVPVTTMVVKDRVLAHNPCGALYQTHAFYKKLVD